MNADFLKDQLQTANEVWKTGYDCGVSDSVRAIKAAIAVAPEGMELLAVTTAMRYLLTSHQPEVKPT